MFDYASTPFPRQPRKWPGVGGGTKQMPRSLAGDSSHQGSGRLIGRKALVTGVRAPRSSIPVLGRVNAVAPGPRTDLGADTCWRGGARQAKLASTYVLLASNESSYATGQLFGAVGASGL